MDYAFRENNLLCRLIGHRWQQYTDRNGVARKTCSMDGKTIPPFRQLRQQPPYDYLPDDEQPAGAV